MSQVERERLQDRERVHLGALIDREQRDELFAVAKRQDRSVSSVVRTAVAAELAREKTAS